MESLKGFINEMGADLREGETIPIDSQEVFDQGMQTLIKRYNTSEQVVFDEVLSDVADKQSFVKKEVVVLKEMK